MTEFILKIKKKLFSVRSQTFLGIQLTFLLTFAFSLSGFACKKKNPQPVDEEKKGYWLKMNRLHFSVRYHCFEYVQYLLNSGEDPNSEQFNGKLPLHEAILSIDNQVISLLIEKTKNLNHRDKEGRTPIYTAVELNKVSVVKELIRAGADPKIADDSGITPLHLASYLNYPELIEVLIENGVDPNSRDKDGNTPLHKLTFNGKADALKKLLEKKASPILKNLDGLTPLEIADKKNLTEITELFSTYPDKK